MLCHGACLDARHCLRAPNDSYISFLPQMTVTFYYNLWLIRSTGFLPFPSVQAFHEVIMYLLIDEIRSPRRQTLYFTLRSYEGAYASSSSGASTIAERRSWPDAFWRAPALPGEGMNWASWKITEAIYELLTNFSFSSRESSLIGSDCEAYSRAVFEAVNSAKWVWSYLNLCLFTCT
jgi:hypothetical protein